MFAYYVHFIHQTHDTEYIGKLSDITAYLSSFTHPRFGTYLETYWFVLILTYYQTLLTIILKAH